MALVKKSLAGWAKAETAVRARKQTRGKRLVGNMALVRDSNSIAGRVRLRQTKLCLRGLYINISNLTTAHEIAAPVARFSRNRRDTRRSPQRELHKIQD